MNGYDLKTLIPTIAAVIVFICNAFNHPIDQMDAYQLATAIATLAVILIGVFTNHKKQPPQDNKPTPPPMP